MKITRLISSVIVVAPLLLTVIEAISSPAPKKVPILADDRVLQKLAIPMVKHEADLRVGMAEVTMQERERISKLSHDLGRCGGYQVIEKSQAKNEISALRTQVEKEIKLRKIMSLKQTQKNKMIDFDPRVRDAVRDVSEAKIGEWITWLSNFGGRYHGSATPNVHTEALANKLREMTAQLNYPVRVELVPHVRTQQKSVRLVLQGSQRPQEIVVLGGHLDSVNWGSGNRNTAPGADDNASGSSSLLEALRIILNQGQPQRTLEFMWYAAEEVGLYGSAEIARSYRDANKDVVAVLQLDMTLHPGSGEGTISSVADFTSAWLRGLLIEFNQHYLNVNIISDECGYGCSDHASWFQKGYHTLMPFESHTRDMNGAIHTPEDRLKPSSSLRHAAIFSKIGVAFAMVLANSELRAPN